MTDLTFRLAEAADAKAVADLHAASWQAHYRGSLTDAYLDGPVFEERGKFWAEHLASPRAGQIVLMAEDAGGLVGFACTLVDEDPVSGTLIDNLHVTLARKTGGIGRALMREVAERLAALAPDRPVHLFVKEANVSARAFYARIGGQEAAHEKHTGVDGSESPVIRVQWTSPAALAVATASIPR